MPRYLKCSLRNQVMLQKRKLHQHGAIPISTVKEAHHNKEITLGSSMSSINIRAQIRSQLIFQNQLQENGYQWLELSLSSDPA